MSNESSFESVYVVYYSSEYNDYIISELSDIATEINVINKINFTHVKFTVKGVKRIVLLDPSEEDTSDSYNCYSSLPKASLGLRQKHIFRSKKDLQNAFISEYKKSVSADDLVKSLDKRLDKLLDASSSKILEKHLESMKPKMYLYLRSKYTEPKNLHSDFADILFHVVRQVTSEIVKKALIENCIDFSITINSPIKIPEVTYPVSKT